MTTARRWTAVDAALLDVVRLAMEDGWTAPAAAAQLRSKVPEDSVLRRARVRVRTALSERPTPMAQRAALTLDLVLDGAAARHAAEVSTT